MDQSTPKVIKLGLPKTKSHHIIQKTYVIYTPKIIKFIYHTNSSNLEHLPLSLQIKEPQSIYSSGKKNNKSSSNEFKTPKIKLVSRKTTQLEQKSDKNYPSVYCSSKSQKIVILSKTKKKNRQLCSSQHKSQIKTEPIVDVVNCDLFGCIEPLDKQEISLPRHNLQKIQSRLITLSHPIQIEDQPKIVYPDAGVQAEDEKTMLKDGNISLSRRNKIFEPLKKDRLERADSVEYNSIRHSLSRRKRIFQRTQSQRKDYSYNHSLTRRNTIFSAKKQKKQLLIPYIKLNSSEIIEQSQIPEYALGQWQKQSLNKKENHIDGKHLISQQPLQITRKKQSFHDL